MKKQIVFATVLLIIGIVACQKEKPRDPNMSPGGGTIHHYQTRFLPQPQVTFDENGAGEWHNYYLDQVYDQLENDISTIGYNNVDQDDIENSIETMVNAIVTGNDSTFHRNNVLSLNSYLNGESITTNLSAIRGAISRMSITNVMKNGINVFWSRCDTVRTKAGATALANAFKTWANTNLQSTEKLIAIGTADVFESSFHYWDDNIDKWNSLLSNNTGGDNSQQMKASISAADAAGWTWGAIVGATGGSIIIPGVGTFVGWAAGGLAGAFNGSALAAINNFFTHLFG